MPSVKNKGQDSIAFRSYRRRGKDSLLVNNQFGSTEALGSQIVPISRYISQGVGESCGECIGMELEHFIVTKKSHEYVPFLENPLTGQPGVLTVLKRLKPFYTEAVYEPQPDGSQVLIGLSRKKASISLEPGAQFEISIGPVIDIQDLETLYYDFRGDLDPILDDLGFELIELGYHPSICARDVPLLPKGRYRFMNEYFKHTGQHGICMMRATASTQVSIDFISEKDAIDKFRIAHALSPLLAFITDNSPIFELEAVGSGGVSASGLAVPDRMVRTKVWNDVDAVRSNTAPGTFDEGFSFDLYAKNTLLGPAIFSFEYDSHGRKRSIDQTGRTVAEVYAEKALDKTTIELILSLYFYDVRFKTYIEIRAADSLPIAYALSYTAFLKGLFYDEGTVSDLATRFHKVSAEDVAAAKRELGKNAFEADVYGRKAMDWLDELLVLAEGSLPDYELSYLEPLKTLITERNTLFDSS